MYIYTKHYTPAAAAPDSNACMPLVLPPSNKWNNARVAVYFTLILISLIAAIRGGMNRWSCLALAAG